MSKELWFAEMEARMAELQDEGMSDDAAYALASDQAHDRVRDRLADMADNYRQARKDGAL